MAVTLEDLIDEKQSFAISALKKSEDWKNFQSRGAGENNIAGSHQGRYLLELLKNAGDAAKDGQKGKVLVVVTDQAVPVDNSGKPFQVDELKVLDAVYHLSRSSKAGSEGYIGHKGIGMKSIMLQVATLSITMHWRVSTVRAYTIDC